MDALQLKLIWFNAASKLIYFFYSPEYTLHYGEDTSDSNRNNSKFSQRERLRQIISYSSSWQKYSWNKDKSTGCTYIWHLILFVIR